LRAAPHSAGGASRRVVLERRFPRRGREKRFRALTKALSDDQVGCRPAVLPTVCLPVPPFDHGVDAGWPDR
jgi:hypothetical protein